MIINELRRKTKLFSGRLLHICNGRAYIYRVERMKRIERMSLNEHQTRTKKIISQIKQTNR